MSHAEMTLPASASSVPLARHFISTLVASWGLADIDWPATLVVSELAANAALHARTPFTVGATLDDDGRLRLEVSDQSRRAPQERAYAVDATTGRGLRLVRELATAWGVEDRDTGKTVWVVLESDGEGAGRPEQDAEVHQILAADRPATPARSAREDGTARRAGRPRGVAA